jgi:hypothetical protein
MRDSRFDCTVFPHLVAFSDNCLHSRESEAERDNKARRMAQGDRIHD